jgi:catechol 2,3-dioxygenase-like lactoylglutathione lyase family enzyme
MRVARPTTDIERAITFWTQVVGLEILSRFEDHEGYDGVILGNSGGQWEIEVTRHSSGMPLPSPSEEDIIVLYLNKGVAREITDRLRHAGHPPKEHPNPYWQAMGSSVHADPDGYTLIILPNE